MSFSSKVSTIRGSAISFSSAVILTILSSCASSPPIPEQNETKSQNIVFILVDDLRFDGMGFLNSQLQTPNIDYLAENGVYFPNAVVTSSLCSPSRATILTGMTARNHGIIDNNNSSEEGLIFFPTYLQNAGYQTAFFGKWHMGQKSDDPRPGFDHWVSFRGQGTYFPTELLSFQDIAAGKKQTLDVNGTNVDRKGYITDELTDYMMNWLEEERDPNKPFFIYLSHKAVHVTPKPPERYQHQYDEAEFELPASSANTEKNYEGKPLWVENQRNSTHGIDFPFYTDQPMSSYLKDYYATLSPVDDSIGRLLGYLKAHGIEENTLIVFYSDNGFLIGDHGLIDKRNAYEPSVRVPMIMYSPSHLPKGKVRSETIRNLDLAPTFLDVAHVPAPPQFEGRSILPLATGEIREGEWQEDDFVYEYYWEWNYPHTPTTFAITRNRMKYIQYHGVWDTEELYNLKLDPNEMTNLIVNPDYLETKIELRRALHDALEREDGNHVVPFTERYGSGLIRRNESGAQAAQFPNAWLSKPNRPDRYNDLFPDSPEKQQAIEDGKPYIPWDLLKEQ